MRNLVFAALLTVVSAIAFGTKTPVKPESAAAEREVKAEYAPSALAPDAVREIQPGWKLSVIRTLPEPINALAVAKDLGSDQPTLVYAGTSGEGNLYRFNPIANMGGKLISASMGDQPRFGTCHVNAVAFHDLNGDGVPELLASTSQVQPLGRPRLYAWSSPLPDNALQAVARPDIRSSWGHSIGPFARPGQGNDSLFVTFCGYGEIVEYRMETQASPSGFRREALSWKTVGQLPASGEWLQVADADNDGADEVCVATGFSVGRAAVHLYASDAPGAPLRLEQAIEEGGRFGNVRFLVSPIDSGGGLDLLAWWSTELIGGQAEMIRYRLGPEGVRRRTVLARMPAAELWADDGQFVTGDLDRDGRSEVWFATHGGDVWRYAPALAAAPQRMLRLNRNLGPIATVAAGGARPPCLVLGSDRDLMTLTLERIQFQAGLPGSGAELPPSL